MNREEAIKKIENKESVKGINFRYVDLSGADLHGSDLHDADLLGIDLHGANLSKSNLRNANLRDADLSYADLHGADLHGANLCEAYLFNVDLHGAKNIMAIYVPDMSVNGNYLYAVKHDAVIMVKIGFWWGTIDEFLKPISQFDSIQRSKCSFAIDFIRQVF